ncbi:DUF4131 domain-containing protein, partial [Thermoproteota archaeon]
MGILAATFIKIHFICVYLLAFLILTLLLILYRKTKINGFLVILLFFLIGLLHYKNFLTLKPNDIYYICEKEGVKITLEGRVASEVVKGPYDNSFIFHPKATSEG